MSDSRTHVTAGAASAAPAVTSVAADAVPHLDPAADLVAPEARVELDRIRRRWGELPLQKAHDRMPVLRRLLAELAPRSAPLVAGSPVAEASVGAANLGSLQSVESSGTAAYCLEVPDLGPAVVADQLAVLVWDAYAARRGIGIPDLLGRARHDLG